MKKTLRLFLAILALVAVLSSMTTVFAAASQGKITGDFVRVRSKATTENSDIIMTLSKDTVVTLNGTKTGQEAVPGSGTTWYSITYDGKTGYVYGKYVKEITPEKTVTVKTDNTDFDKQILKFPKSYRKALTEIHNTYPNWVFVPDKLQLTLDEAIDLEYSKSNLSKSKKWVELSYGADWRDTRVDISNPVYILESRWTYASREAIAFFMDPRNGLVIQNKKPSYPNIFTFLQQTYDSSTQNKAGLKTVIAGTFMEKGYGGNKDAYLEVIMEAAKQSGVSPYVIAGTIKIEQGTDGGSGLISGKYKGYEKLYNYFNFGAYGSNVVVNGLKFAKNKGWTTRKKSIVGGAKLYASGYINAGQDTYYYMDFNVKYPDNIWHQYASALYDQCTKAVNMRSVSLSNKSAVLTFKIPVYKSLPSAVYGVPKIHTCKGYIKGAKSATCTEDGYTGDKICKICGKKMSKGKVIKKTGHSAGTPKNAKAATCTQKGYTGDKYCKYCDKLLSKGSEIKAKGHILGRFKNAKAPTCANNGYTGDICCKNCDKKMIPGTVIKSTGHTYGAWITDIPATKNTAAQGHRICTACGAAERGNIPVS